jgi:hypothetical protein
MSDATIDPAPSSLQQATRPIVQLAATVATLHQDLTIVQHRHLELQHRHDELVAATAWRSPEDPPLPFFHVHIWLDGYVVPFYGHRTNKGEWLALEGQRMMPVGVAVKGWQYRSARTHAAVAGAGRQPSPLSRSRS